VENSGGKLWQPGSKQWVPHARISIPEQARYLGFQTVQAAIIDKNLDPTWITIYNTEYAGAVGIAFSGTSILAAIVSIIGFWRWYKRKKRQQKQKQETDEAFANDQLAYDSS
jgi:TRAP-type C4-dicarboxylate transport system permease small subunit